jgi:hypothetical protein
MGSLHVFPGQMVNSRMRIHDMSGNVYSGTAEVFVAIC